MSGWFNPGKARHKCVGRGRVCFEQACDRVYCSLVFLHFFSRNMQCISPIHQCLIGWRDLAYNQFRCWNRNGRLNYTNRYTLRDSILHQHFITIAKSFCYSFQKFIKKTIFFYWKKIINEMAFNVPLLINFLNTGKHPTPIVMI